LASTVAVLELTADNFVSTTSQGFAFVVFFAPWCKHCQVLKPVFQELARQMSNTPGLIFATVGVTHSAN
jgi:thioredoxin domain-containing protein 5